MRAFEIFSSPKDPLKYRSVWSFSAPQLLIKTFLKSHRLLLALAFADVFPPDSLEKKDCEPPAKNLRTKIERGWGCGISSLMEEDKLWKCPWLSLLQKIGVRGVSRLVYVRSWRNLNIKPKKQQNLIFNSYRGRRSRINVYNNLVCNVIISVDLAILLWRM